MILLIFDTTHKGSIFRFFFKFKTDLRFWVKHIAGDFDPIGNIFWPIISYANIAYSIFKLLSFNISLNFHENVFE